jgi:molybdopterin converting factor small subunit
MTKTRISLRLLSFGMAADIVGHRELSLETQAGSLGDLRGELVLKYPDLEQLAALQLAVNQQYRSDDYVLAHMDEVAIIPPVSGG